MKHSQYTLKGALETKPDLSTASSQGNSYKGLGGCGINIRLTRSCTEVLFGTK